jgi:dTDP-4-dehydrorhamnose 3,5-epimerase
MQVLATAIPEILLLVPRRHADPRGWLSETWHRERFAAAGLPDDFVQDNAAFSLRRGTVRGLHFQGPPAAQGKLVRAAAGAAYDVAVDLRQGSPTYGRHVGAELSAEGGECMWVPEGFAHGFCTLTDNTLVLYKMTRYYAPAQERGLLWNDPALGIDWPVAAAEAIVKPVDQNHPRLSDIGAPFPAEA